MQNIVITELLYISLIILTEPLRRYFSAKFRTVERKLSMDPMICTERYFSSNAISMCCLNVKKGLVQKQVHNFTFIFRYFWSVNVCATDFWLFFSLFSLVFSVEFFWFCEAVFVNLKFCFVYTKAHTTGLDADWF